MGHAGEKTPVTRKHKKIISLGLLAFALSGTFAHANDRTLKDLQEAVRLKPSDAAARYNLGNGLFKRGYFDEAIEEYRQSLRLNPNDADAHNNLGVIFYQRGSFEEAAEQFNDALKINP